MLNGGVVGYSGEQAARRAELLLDTVQPDLVLLFLSPSSQCMLQPDRSSAVRRVGDRWAPRFLVDPAPGWARPALATADERLLSSHLYTRWRAGRLDQAKRGHDLQGFVLTRDIESPEAAERVDRTFAEFASLKELLDRRQILLRAVVMPDKYLATDWEWDTFLKRRRADGGPPPDTPRSEPTEVLFERLEELGIGCYTLVQALEEFGEEKVRFTCDGVHWNAVGHRVVAGILLEQMDAEGVLPLLSEFRAGRPRR